jgi:hypothetical protein
MRTTTSSQSVVALGAAAGVMAPALLLATFVGLTVAEWDWLRGTGWSAVRRTPVEWPSILALGHYGWAESVAFAVCGALGLLFAFALAQSRGPSQQRATLVAAVAIAVVSVTLALDAFRADPAHVRTWHGQLHNLVYPVIPIGLTVAATAFAAGARSRFARQLSATVAAVIAVATLLGFVDGVAQLARYLLLASAILWLELAAWSLSRSCRRVRQH